MPISRQGGRRPASRRGIVVDADSAIRCPGHLRRGECADIAEPCYGLVDPPMSRARPCFEILSGGGPEYRGIHSLHQLKVSGVKCHFPPATSLAAQPAPSRSALRSGFWQLQKACDHRQSAPGAVLVSDSRTELLVSRQLIRSARPIRDSATISPSAAPSLPESHRPAHVSDSTPTRSAISKALSRRGKPSR